MWQQVLTWTPTVLLIVLAGGLAGVGWYALAPTTVGQYVRDMVRYPVPDYPPASVAALYVVIVLVAGLLAGIPVVARQRDRPLARLVVHCVAGVLAAGATYVVGYILGPAPEAVQIAADPGHVQVPLVLPTPLLVLVWPAATASLVTIGLLLSAVLYPEPAGVRSPGHAG
ncbi:MAG: hypothetical protein ACK5MT_18580 [Actinomycetales bacterium]